MTPIPSFQNLVYDDPEMQALLSHLVDRCHAVSIDPMAEHVKWMGRDVIAIRMILLPNPLTHARSRARLIKAIHTHFDSEKVVSAVGIRIKGVDIDHSNDQILMHLW